MISRDIKRVLFEKDMTIKDLAELLGCTPENMYKKFKKDDWKESDIYEIAKVLDCEYKQIFKIKEIK